MDWLEKYQQQRKELEDRDAAAKQSNSLVGRYLEHPMGDGHAVYVITKVNARSVDIEHVKIGDAYIVPAWGTKATVPLDKAKAFLAHRDAIAYLVTKADDWWSERAIGEVVHYSNGFGQFVRGKVIVYDGQKQMLPTDLVGAWEPREVVTLRPNGSVSYGTYAEWIIKRHPIKPHATNMVEHPEHKLRGTDGDPRKMKRVPIPVPTMNAEQAALASVIKLQESVLAALATELSGNPSVDYANVKAALRRAAKLIDEGI